MQYVPEQLRKVLHDRLKSGFISKPVLRVEVDRFNFVPGYVEELRLYDSDFQKTVTVREITEGEEIVTTKAPMTFPLKGLSWSDEGKKFHYTSGYGMRWGKMHRGVDMQTAGAGNASDIVAVYPGKVTKVDYQSGGAGYYVKIQHDEGLLTKYFHLKKGSIVVKEGQHVEAGQKIGVEGNTGSVRGQVDGGRHLHIETWVNGVAENPLPWLKGEKQITTKQTVQSGLTKPGETTTKVEEVIVGYPGDVVINEQIKTYGWMNNPAYKSMGGVSSVDTKSVGGGYYRAYFNFYQGSSANHGFYITVNMKRAGWFDFDFSSNFSGKDGDYLAIYVNGKLVAKKTSFSGLNKKDSLKDIAVPEGSAQIMIFMQYGGKMADNGNSNSPKQFAFHSFKIQELDQTKTEQQIVEVEGEPVPVNVDPISIENFIYNEIPIDIHLQTGKFIYQDTLVLENVQKCEVERNLEQEAAEATLTITNPDGYYSPDYNPYYFPELMGKYKPSPWSYYIPGGFHVGVLAENTPIRIYMGYGTQNERPIRVFTGLIDSTDINGGDGSITIKCRDMYKKILNTVLMRRKEYGSEPVYETTQQAQQTVANATLSRREQIYAAAKKAQNEYNLPDDAYYFLLAICWHETVFGTKGAGRESSGSYILGYGVPDSGKKQTQYAGIEKQMHYGAKRYYEALKSRGHKVDSLDDVKYFWKGGDKGKYQWATDTNWPNGVWSAYLKITGQKSEYSPPSATIQTTPYSGGSSPSTLPNTGNSNNIVPMSSGGTTETKKTVDPPYPGGIYDKPMYNNETVKLIQKKLIEKGYSIPDGATGNFLSQTDSAVRKFQKDVGITVDGDVGPVTWGKLFEKIETIYHPPPAPVTKLVKEGEQWLKTAIVADLIGEAGMYGWRVAEDDMDYPDSVIEESYYTEFNERTGKVVKALSDEEATEEKRFETVDIKDLQIKTPEGWMNPFVEPPTTFVELKWKISDAINELIKDTTYRSYCDRYGAYRLERINLNTPIVAEYRDDENLISLSKNIDYSRARSHLVIYDDGVKDSSNKDYIFASFIDKELLLELKGEARTAVVVVPWAKTNEMKREVAKKLFFDMKRNSRTLQISIPGNPALDLLDRIKIVDKNSATNSSYHIKGIRDSFDMDTGYIQILDLTWSTMDQIIQIPDLIMNTEPPEEPIPPEPPKKEEKEECVMWDKKIYKKPMYSNDTVKKIQQKLISLGYSIPAGATGNYLDQTVSAVTKFQKNKGLKADGIVGELTWNKMFCPSWKPPEPPPVKKITYSSGLTTRSWRDNWKWRSDNSDVYQGEWENWGHHYGFIFIPSDLPGKLKGKNIKKVKLYLHRYRKQGYYSAQKPTFWLSKLSSASGTPSVISGTNWTSNVGWAVDDKKWVELPVSYGEAIRDGKAKSICIYTDKKSPYICFRGGNSVKLEIETS